MQQENILGAEHNWTNPLNPLQEAIHYLLQNSAFTAFLSGTNSLCTMPGESKKIINIVLMWDLWNFFFFGQGDVSPIHSELFCFVLGS